MSQKFKRNIYISFFVQIIITIFLISVIGKGIWSKSFFISFFITLEFNAFLFLILENLELNKEQREYLDARLGKIIEYFALGTGENGNLEKIIDSIRRKGKIRWLVAKFISEKMRRAFENKDDKTLVIKSNNINEYQDLLDNIIGDCEKSLYWTCPFLPQTWFKDVKKTEKAKDKNFEQLQIKDLPLLKRFSDSTVKKFRFVNLSGSNFEKLIGKNKNNSEAEDLFKNLAHFIRINEKSIRNCKLLFLNLAEKSEPIRNCLTDNKDLGIYDEEVTISFDKENQNITLTLGCHQIFPFLDDFQKYLRNNEREGIYDVKAILNKFKEETQIDVEGKFKEITGINIKL